MLKSRIVRKIVHPGFEPGSSAPEADRIGHYPNGLYYIGGECETKRYRFQSLCRGVRHDDSSHRATRSRRPHDVSPQADTAVRAFSRFPPSSLPGGESRDRWDRRHHSAHSRRFRVYVALPSFAVSRERRGRGVPSPESVAAFAPRGSLGPTLRGVPPGGSLHRGRHTDRPPCVCAVSNTRD